MDIFGRRSSLLTVVLLTTLTSTSGRYLDDGVPSPQAVPSILVHKQALNDDGSFNFVFAADNGLRQGERILPDGTRIGAYSYVDPNGETISVKYKAGKDGFKILEGAHIPTPAAFEDPSDDTSDLLLPTTTPKVIPITSPPPPKIRGRLKKDTARRPVMKMPLTPKKIRVRGTKSRVPLVMMHRMPNESEQRVASFHVEQPTFRGHVNKAYVDGVQTSRNVKQDLFNGKDYPKAYSFQFGSA